MTNVPRKRLQILLSLRPLERYAIEAIGDPDASDRQIARYLGLHHHTLHVIRQDGGITPTMADRVAAHLNHHPSFFWGNEWLSINAQLQELRNAAKRERQQRRRNMRREGAA
jgi:plasmid maintenance system antidote protein VapI